jgi:hypothetical protein
MVASSLHTKLTIVNNTPDLQIEHQNIPTNHQGLHDFLYSAADEHAVVAQAQIELDRDAILPAIEWRALAENARVAGVYAVLNTQKQTQYIGYSRNISTSLKGHIATHGSDICAYIQVRIVKSSKREEMENLRDSWIAELGLVPPGNTDLSEGWTTGEVNKAAMSEPERAAYEEKKLKLRRAMADGTLSRELDPPVITDDQKRDNFTAAMTEDNWSAVIKEQSAETV